MADRVLPSREEAEAWLHTSAGSGYGRRFVQAYVSGRLVDREAIDYEAMWREYQESSFGNLGRPFTEKRRTEMEALAAAALGEV